MSVPFIALAVVLYSLHLEHPDWLPIDDILPGQAVASKRFALIWI